MSNGKDIGEINPTTGRPWGQEDRGKVNSKTIFDDSSVVDIDDDIQAQLNLPPEELKVSPVEERRYYDDKIEEIQLDENISKFSEYGVKVNTLNDFRNNRALNQSTAEKFRRSIGKMYTIAGTTFLDGTLGTLIGLGTAIAEGRPSAIWDNPFSNAMVDIQEYVEKEYPNYYTNVEQASPFYHRMFSGGGYANFWGDTILKNFGFAMGAMAAGLATAGVAEAGLTAGAGRFFGRKAFGTLGKALGKNPQETLRMLKLGEAALTETGTIGGKTVGIMDDLSRLAKTQKAISASTEIIGSVSGAIGEGRIEAINSSREYYNKLRDQGLTLEEAEERAVAHGNLVFALNTALLTMGNYAQYRKVFSGGYNPNRLALAGLKNDLRAGYEAAKIGPIRGTAKVLKNPVIEGLEEMNQFVIQKGSEKYINRRYNPEANEAVNGFVSSMIDGMAEAYGSEEGWENFVAGFITGGVGVFNLPKMITQRKLSLEGGIWEDIKDIRSQNKKAESLAEQFADYKDKGAGKLLERTSRSVAHMIEQDKAVIKGDAFEFKNIEHDDLVNETLKFEEAGKTDDLISDLKAIRDLSAEEIKKISSTKEVNSETGEVESKKDDPEFDIFGGMTNSQIEEAHRERVDNYIARIENILEVARMVDMASGGRISDDLREKLIHEASTIEDTEERIKSLSSEINEWFSEFRSTDPEFFEEMKRMSVRGQELGFNVSDITQQFVNQKQFQNWRDALDKYIEQRKRKDKAFKIKWTSEMRSKLDDLNKLYGRRDEFIESYSEAFQNKKEVEARLEYEKNLIEGEIRDWSLKMQRLNITGEKDSFLSDNTRGIEVTNPLTGETDNVLVSKSLKVNLPDGSSIKTSRVGPEDKLVEPVAEEEDVAEEISDRKSITMEQAKESQEGAPKLEEPGVYDKVQGVEETEAQALADIEEQEEETVDAETEKGASERKVETEDAEFEIKGINGQGNLTLVDQNGIKAYFNQDGTLSYNGEVYDEFSFEEVRGIDENIKRKKQQAKLNALAQYLKGAETRYRNTERSIKEVDQKIEQLNKDLKEAIYLEQYTKAGKERRSGIEQYSKAIIDIENQIAELEKKKIFLQNELSKLEELYTSIKSDIGMTKKEYTEFDETQRKADEKKADVTWGEFIRNIFKVDSIEGIDDVILKTKEAIDMIQQRIDALKKARDSYKEIDEFLLPSEIVNLTEEQLSDIIYNSLESGMSMEEAIRTDREKQINRKLKELRSTLEDYNKTYSEMKQARTMVKRLEFIENYYEDLKKRAFDEYIKILGAKFGKVEDKGNAKEKNREQEISEKKDLSTPKHVFTGTGADFLHTAGGNEIPKTGKVTEKIKRWFSFLNRNTSARFIAYSKNNIPDSLKDKIKFNDDEDIVIVPVDKKGNPISVSGKKLKKIKKKIKRKISGVRSIKELEDLRSLLPKPISEKKINEIQKKNDKELEKKGIEKTSVPGIYVNKDGSILPHKINLEENLSTVGFKFSTKVGGKTIFVEIKPSIAPDKIYRGYFKMDFMVPNEEGYLVSAKSKKENRAKLRDQINEELGLDLFHEEYKISEEKLEGLRDSLNKIENKVSAKDDIATALKMYNQEYNTVFESDKYKDKDVAEKMSLFKHALDNYMSPVDWEEIIRDISGISYSKELDPEETFKIPDSYYLEFNKGLIISINEILGIKESVEEIEEEVEEEVEESTGEEKIPYASLAAPSYMYPEDSEAKGKDRFTYDKIRKQLKADNPKATKEEIDAQIDSLRKQALEEYEEIRNSILNGEPMEFESKYRTPGYRNDNSRLVNAKGAIFSSEKEIDKIYFDAAVTEGFRPTKHSQAFNTKVGHFYIYKDSNLLTVYEKKLSDIDGETDRLVRLFKKLAEVSEKEPNGDEAKKIYKHLKTILYFSDNPGNIKYKLSRDRKNNKIYFGKENITLKDFNENSEKVDKFIEFLGEKFHNINSQNVKATKTKYYVLDVNEKGELFQAKEFKNYKHYLFSDEGSSKFLVYAPPIDQQLSFNKSYKLTNTELEAAEGEKTAKEIDDIISEYEDEDEDAGDDPGETPETPKGIDKLMQDLIISIQDGDSIKKVLDRSEAKELMKRLESLDQSEMDDLGLEERAVEDLYTKLDEALGKDKSKKVTLEVSSIGSDTLEFDEDEDEGTDDLEEAMSNRKLDDDYKKEIRKLIDDGDIDEASVLGILNDKDLSLEEIKEEIEATVDYTSEDPDSLLDLRRAAVREKKYKKVTEKEILWFKKKFGLTTIQLEKVRGLIDKNKFGTLTRDLRVLFSEIGIEGTLYHEALHAVTQVFLSEEERGRLYSEIRRNKGSVEIYNPASEENKEAPRFIRKKFSELTDSEVEEFLAEEFRDFMLVGPENYKFGKKAGLKRTLFETIANFAKKILDYIRSGSINIPKWFAAIDEKTFSEDEQKRTEITQDFDMKVMQDRKGNEEVMTQERFSALMSDFKIRFNIKLFNNKDGMSSIDNELSSRSIGNTYRDLRREYIGISRTEIDSKGNKIPKKVRESARDIVKYFDGFVNSHTALLKGIGVDFRIEEFVDEDNKLKDTYQYDTAVSVSQHDITPSIIKLMVLGLPEVQKTKGKLSIKKKAPYMTLVVENYISTMNTLYNTLAGLESYEEMIERVKKLSKSMNSMKVLMNYLGGENQDISEETFLLRAKFQKAFAKNKTKPLLMLLRDDNISFIDAVSQGVATATVEKWKSNVKTGNYSSLKTGKSSLFKMRNGDLQANMYAVARVFGWNVDSSNKLTKQSIPQAGIPERLAHLGINIPVDHASHGDLTEAMNEFFRFFSQEVKRIVDENKKAGNKYIKFDDIFDRNKIAINKELQILAEELSILSNENIELVYFNAEGKREYAVTLNSHLSNTVNRMNKGEIPEYLKPYDEKSNPNGNLVTRYSRTMKHSIDGGTIDVKLLRGLRVRMGEGKDVSDMKPADFEALTANATLHGKSPLLRAADRGMEFSVTNPNHNNNFNRQAIKREFINYLKATLVQNALAIRGEGLWGKAKKFKYESLGYFDFLYPNDAKKGKKNDLVSALEAEITKRENISNEDIIDIVEKLVNRRAKTLGRKIDDHIDKITKATADRLKESNIFFKKGGRYVNIGLSDNLFNGVDKVNGISDDLDGKETVSEETVQKTARALAVNYVFGAFEQAMLFVGDPRHFMKEGAKGGPFDFTDFHKRTTGTAGTRYNSIVGGSFEEDLNKFFKRVDGKSKDRRKIRKVIAEDKNVTTKTYGKEKINAADGQGEILLDEYRDMKLRNADWTTAAETVWQYEQQKFFIEAIEEANKGNESYDPDFFNVENFKEAFPETEYKGLETVITHNGRAITEFDFKTALEPMKPQGFTGMEDEDGFGNSYIPQFSKLSVVPIIPSDLSVEMKARLARMMSNGVDMLVFESGEKAEHAKKVDYDLTDTDEIADAIQYHDYSGIGIQLDVDPSGKSKVIYSTQNGRLITVDHISDALVESFREAREGIIEISKRKLIRGLGLKEDNKVLKFIDSEIGSKSRKKFRNKIIESFSKREMPLNLVQGLDDLLKNSEDIKFDTLISKRQIESILHALVRKELIKTKVSGDALVQQSEVRYGEKLAFYERKDGSISMMEVMVALPKKIYKSQWYKDLVYKGERGLTAINMMMEDNSDQLSDFVREFAGGRIPGSELASLDYVKIKKFLSYQSGPTVVVPAELLMKNGSDFDVDKITAYFYNYYVGKDGIKKPNEYNSVAEFWEENRDTIIEKEDKEFYDTNISPIEQEYDDAIRDSEKRKRQDELFNNKQLARTFGSVIDQGVRKDYKQLEKEWIEARDEYFEERDRLKKERDEKLEQSYNSFFNKNYKNYDLKDFISTDLLENKLVELQKEAIINSPERYDNLISPTSIDTIKKITGEPKKKITATDLFQWTRNADVGKSNFGGIQGVGIGAVETVSHATTQIQNVEIEDPNFSIALKKYAKKADERYYLGHIETSKKGQRISKIFNEFLNAFVDVAKDDRVSRIVQAIEMFPVYALLLRAGTKSTNPMSLEDAVKFLTQPIISEFLRQTSIEDSQVNRARNRKRRSEEKVIKELLGNKERYEENSSYKNYREYLNLSKRRKAGFTGNLSSPTIEMKELVGETVQDRDWIDWKSKFSSEQMDSQAKILNEFLKLKEYAKQLRMLNDITRPDAKYPSSRAELIMQRGKKAMVLNAGVFSRENIENLFKKTYIGALEDVHEDSKTYFDNMFITSKVKKIKESRDKMLYGFLNPSFEFSNTRLDTIARAVEEDIITYLVLTGKDSDTGERISDNYSEMILTGLKSVAQELGRVKAQASKKRSERKKGEEDYSNLKDNRIIKELEPIVNEIDKYTQENIGIDNIKLFSRSNRMEDINELFSSFQELFESHRELAVKIAKLALVQSGFSHSFIDFKNIIPETEMRPILERIIGNGNSFDMNSFYDQFFRNNYHNEDIVPNIYKDLNSDGNLQLERTHKYYEYPYITRWTKKDGVNRKVLYKGVGKGLFKPESPLGVPYKFKEYYPEENPKSLLRQEAKQNTKEDLRTYSGKIDVNNLPENQVFVFGSNTAGGHGGGTAALAQFGKTTMTYNVPKEKKGVLSVYGETGMMEGKKGKSYGLVTKKAAIKEGKLFIGKRKSTNKIDLTNNIKKLYGVARSNRHLDFMVGYAEGDGKKKGMSGWSMQEMADMFVAAGNIPSNIVFNEDFFKLIKIEESKPEAKESPKSGGMPSLRNFKPITDTPVSDELNNSVREFLKSIGVDVNTVETIMDSNDRNVNATGIARLWNMTVDIVKGKDGLNQLPEEAAHFYVSMLPREHAIRKALVANAPKYKVYKQVKEAYQEVYKDHKNPEEMIRLEVAGKLIAEEMKSIDQGTDFVPERANILQRLLSKLMKWIGKQVYKADRAPMIASAKAIMDRDLTDLMDKPDPELTEFFGTNFSEDMTERLEDSEFARKEFGQKKMSNSQLKASVAEENLNELSDEASKELKKSIKDVNELKQEIFDNFEKYFPSYRNFSPKDKSSFLKAIDDGEIEIHCKL